VTGRSPIDVAASVRNRLRDLSRARGEDFQLILTHYAIERLLYRMCKSVHADRFVLKGAMLFSVWTDKPYRTTRDLDLLGRGASSPEAVAATMRDICRQEVKDDGLVFDETSVRAEVIREDQEYEGVRVSLVVTLGAARIPLQVDIGFGDAVVPQEESLTYPTLLDAPAPTLRTYPRESVVAEKLQAMVSLGIANSRMKDFFDIWVLAKSFDFEGDALRQAIEATFKRRQTALPKDVPFCLSDEFVADDAKRRQWDAFQARGRLAEAPASFGEVVAFVRDFIMSPMQAAAGNQTFSQRWAAGGLWRRSHSSSSRSSSTRLPPV
jgi:predicted nucleotidyltransferase component of viral defense system